MLRRVLQEVQEAQEDFIEESEETKDQMQADFDEEHRRVRVALSFFVSRMRVGIGRGLS